MRSVAIRNMCWGLLLVLVLALAVWAGWVARERYRAAHRPLFHEIGWPDLVPAGWTPPDVLRGMNVNRYQDGDPEAIDALARMKNAWADAPPVKALDGRPVRIAGYVIPLDRENDEVHEFLLLPYFGACIHVPPPPSNQIIYVRSKAPLEGMMTMDTFWVNGTLQVSATDSPWGQAGYTLQAYDMQHYEVPAQSTRS